MRYYVTVPGVFHADYTIVQSEGMRETYLEKLSRFLEEEEENLEENAGNEGGLQRKEALLNRKDVLEQMEKKIIGVGSCLLGEKEGRGTKEVVSCFLKLFSQ